jgi:methionine aminopeptidase
MTFEYCLMSAGKSFNRAPSDQRLESGDIFSLDSGGNYKGYIGDLCRMGILGEARCRACGPSRCDRGDPVSISVKS